MDGNWSPTSQLSLDNLVLHFVGNLLQSAVYIRSYIRRNIDFSNMGMKRMGIHPFAKSLGVIRLLIGKEIDYNLGEYI